MVWLLASNLHTCFRLRSADKWADRLAAAAAIVVLAVWAWSILLADNAADPVETSAPKTDVSASQQPQEGQAQREFIIAGYGGAPFTHPSDVHVSNGPATDFTAHDVVWEGQPFKSPIYYGIRTLGWSAGGPFGAMLDFTHSKAISQRGQDVSFSGTREGQKMPEKGKVGETFRHLEFSHGHNTLTLNGMLRLADLAPRLAPYIGGGAGVALPHTEVQLLDEPARTYEYQYVGPAAQGLIGLELRIPRVSIFVEYKFVIAPYTVPLMRRSGGWFPYDFWQQLQSWLKGEKPAGGFLTTTLSSHNVASGLGWRLAASPVPAGR
jgi:hypothetical protein